MPDESQPIDLLNQRPEADIFRDDVVRGLSCDHKRLPCKYFYDQRGSALFEAICELPWYKITRGEQTLLAEQATAIMADCGSVDAAGLHVHQVESVPHVRIEACDSCAGYLKAVDLRKLGGAEPVVDDLATPELDLWASDRGLVKIQANLLGL